MHPRAQQYINDLDAFRENRFNSILKTAKTLEKKDKRSDAQDYELVYAVQQASYLKGMNKDLIAVKSSTKDVRNTVIQERVTQIGLLEPKIYAEKSPAVLVKLLREADSILSELEKIDPSNSVAQRSRKDIAAYITTLSQKDIDAAREKMMAKRYFDAEVLILKAEKSLTAMTKETPPEVVAIKYQIYYNWAASLLDQKIYQSANTKITQAIAVNRTSEAIALKTKINKAASVRDYDAEIGDILDSVDSMLVRGDAAGAQGVIDSTLPKLKNQTNKDNLSAKTAEVNAQMENLYQEGITRYNEEDYEGAIFKFRIVVNINPDYEQAQAYIDRSNTKIRALSGKN
jgi:tetratricopeptide (TPR) repeat protein